MERRTEDVIDSITAAADTDNVSIGGTSRVGRIKATRKELIQQFGEPDNNYPKSTYHWQIRFGDGTVATIYDYKGRNGYLDSDEEATWSVGGRTEDAVEILNILGFESPELATA